MSKGKIKLSPLSTILTSCHFQLMKIPVAPESTRVCTENNWEMSVVLREIGMYREILQALRALIMGYKESFFSYLEQ